MSRPSRVCARCAELETALERERAAYQELALTVAKGWSPLVPTVTGPRPPIEGQVVPTIPALPKLPDSVLGAIEDTTEPFTEARTMAIEAARALLEQGVKAEDVEAQLRNGEEIAV